MDKLSYYTAEVMSSMSPENVHKLMRLQLPNRWRYLSMHGSGSTPSIVYEIIHDRSQGDKSRKRGSLHVLHWVLQRTRDWCEGFNRNYIFFLSGVMMDRPYVHVACFRRPRPNFSPSPHHLNAWNRLTYTPTFYKSEMSCVSTTLVTVEGAG